MISDYKIVAHHPNTKMIAIEDTSYEYSSLTICIKHTWGSQKSTLYVTEEELKHMGFVLLDNVGGMIYEMKRYQDDKQIKEVVEKYMRSIDLELYMHRGLNKDKDIFDFIDFLLRSGYDVKNVEALNPLTKNNET